MRQIDLSRLLRSAALAMATLLSACGGGGGTGVVPAFRVQSGVVVADFNADGRDDVAVATTTIAGPPPHPGYVQVYLQTAGGSFDVPVQYAIGPDPWGMSAGDADGDGRLDLVVATPSTVAAQANAIGDSGGVSILRQDRTQPGRFLASQWIATGGMAEDAAMADLNGDGRADLIVADGVGLNGRALGGDFEL